MGYNRDGLFFLYMQYFEKFFNMKELIKKINNKGRYMQHQTFRPMMKYVEYIRAFVTNNEDTFTH